MNDWDRNYYLNQPWLNNLIQLMVVLTLELVCGILWRTSTIGPIYTVRSYYKPLIWSLYMVPSSLIFFALLFSSLETQLLRMTVHASRALRFIVFAALLAFLTYQLFLPHQWYWNPSGDSFPNGSVDHEAIFFPLALFGFYILCYLVRAQVASFFIHTQRFLYYIHHRASTNNLQ